MDNYNARYERAKRQVNALKGFYNHLKIFVFLNGLFYLGKSGLLDALLPEELRFPSYYYSWVDLNTLIWGGILLVHFVVVFHNKLPFLKKWEERQIQKYMEEDSEGGKRYR